MSEAGLMTHKKVLANIAKSQPAQQVTSILPKYCSTSQFCKQCKTCNSSRCINNLAISRSRVCIFPPE